MTESMKHYIKELKATYHRRMYNGEYTYEVYERKLEILAEKLGLSIFDIIAA